MGLSLFSPPFLPLQFIRLCLVLPSKHSSLTPFYSFPTPDPLLHLTCPTVLTPTKTSLYLLWPLFFSCTGLLSAPYKDLVINSHLRAFVIRNILQRLTWLSLFLIQILAQMPPPLQGLYCIPYRREPSSA